MHIKKKKDTTKHKLKVITVAGSGKHKDVIYECDGCGNTFKTVTKIYNQHGEFGYCDTCLAEKYPTYKKITLYSDTVNALNYLSNEA